MHKSSFLKEVRESILKAQINRDPFPYISFQYRAYLFEELEYIFPSPVTDIVKSELGRSKVLLSDLKGIDFRLWERWDSLLNAEESKSLVFELINRINADKCFRKSLWRARRQKLIKILTPRALVLRLESLAKIRDEKSKPKLSAALARKMLELLAVIGYYDDATVEINNILPADSVTWQWEFVTDFDCTNSLPPHTDAPHKVLTVLFPMSSSLYFRPGTSLLKSRSGNVVNWASARIPECLFDVCYTSPHQFGHGLAFAKGAKTWHSVEKGQKLPEGENRKTLILSVSTSLPDRNAVSIKE